MTTFPSTRGNSPALTARRPNSAISCEEFIEGVGRVPTQPLKKALVAVFQVIADDVPSLIGRAIHTRMR